MLSVFYCFVCFFLCMNSVRSFEGIHLKGLAGEEFS